MYHQIQTRIYFDERKENINAFINAFNLFLLDQWDFVRDT